MTAESIAHPPRRWGASLRRASLAAFCALALIGCAGGEPEEFDHANACNLATARAHWVEPLNAASVKWGVPRAIILAIIWRESRFEAQARPPKRNGKHLSTAYGYAQAIDGTWDWYRDSTGKTRARRDDFAAAVDFVGWYMDRSRNMLGLDARHAYGHYIAYHEGHGGFRRGRWKENPRLLKAAAEVERRALAYTVQLKQCRPG